MITKGFLTAKIREICLWKGQNPPAGIVDMIYPKFERYDEADLNQAIETLQNDEEKFTPGRLKRAVNNIVFARETRHWEATKIQEAREADRFWNTAETGGGDKCPGACRGCSYPDRCRIRAAEWIKGLRWVMADGPFPPGEGKRRAEEIIRVMAREFMGGLGK